jgi:hypothetical protein
MNPRGWTVVGSHDGQLKNFTFLGTTWYLEAYPGAGPRIWTRHLIFAWQLVKLNFGSFRRICSLRWWWIGEEPRPEIYQAKYRKRGEETWLHCSRGPTLSDLAHVFAYTYLCQHYPRLDGWLPASSDDTLQLHIETRAFPPTAPSLRCGFIHVGESRNDRHQTVG